VAIQTGDLILWESKLWLVYKVDPDTETAFIESQDNERGVLGIEVDCQVTCNPPLDWPAITVPPKRGHIVRIQRGATPLRWLLDWVKMSTFQMGGTLYLNPNLGLQFGDRLALTLRTNAFEKSIPVEVPRDFVPVNEKRRVREMPPPERITATLYDHLLDDD